MGASFRGGADPRGQAAPAGAHTAEPFSTTRLDAPPPHVPGATEARRPREAQTPVATSRTRPAGQVRKAPPPAPSGSAAGPQNASATAGGTQAPRSTASPSPHAQRPDASR